MKKKMLFGSISAIIAIGVFLVVLFSVQYFNTDLNDINLILNNFKRTQIISENASIVEAKENTNPMLYRIEDTGIVLVLQIDGEWKNGQKGMNVWQEHDNLTASTEEIMENSEKTVWLLSLYERNVGPWMLYKEINMNQQATNMDSILDSIFESKSEK